MQVWNRGREKNPEGLDARQVSSPPKASQRKVENLNCEEDVNSHTAGVAYDAKVDSKAVEDNVSNLFSKFVDLLKLSMFSMACSNAGMEEADPGRPRKPRLVTVPPQKRSLPPKVLVKTPKSLQQVSPLEHVEYPRGVRLDHCQQLPR